MTTAIRASSFGHLLDCAHSWEGTHVMGLRRPASGPMALGTAVHASTGAFDQARIDKSGLTVMDTAAVLVDSLRNPQEEVDWGDDSKAKAERIGLSLHGRYCNDVSPRYTYKSVEQQLEPLDVSAGGIVIRLTGKMDRARVTGDGTELGIRDLKTGKRAVDVGTQKANVKGHGAQLGVYQLLAEHTFKVPFAGKHGVIALQTSGMALIGEADIENPKALLIGTKDEPGLIEYAASILKTGMMPPNPSTWRCSQKFCARWDHCRFHG